MLHIRAARKPKMTAIKLTPHHFVRTLFCRQLMQAAMIGRAAGRDVNAGGRSKPVARRPCLCKFISDAAIEEIVIASDSEATQTEPKPDKWGYLGSAARSFRHRQPRQMPCICLDDATQTRGLDL
jgi:hypothetical protein